MKFLSLFFFLALIVHQQPNNTGLEKLFANLSTAPSKKTISSKLIINNQGGHLQGVQTYSFEGKKYLLFSGSSSTYGYLAVADDTEFRKLHILAHRPLKHAGGFQIQGNWLAVGIEDNETRTISKVYVYQLGNPLEAMPLPAATVERSGPYQRATAGAVAIQQIDQKLLLIVGDWGNRHLDFYKAEIIRNSNTVSFEKTSEIDMDSHPRSGWIDTFARSYQNVNLLHYDSNLYLVGFAGAGDHEDIVDIFQIDNPFDTSPTLTKVLTKSFKNDGTTRFNWGAGLSLDPEQGLFIYSCGDHVTDKTMVSVYR